MVVFGRDAFEILKLTLKGNLINCVVRVAAVEMGKW